MLNQPISIKNASVVSDVEENVHYNIDEKMRSVTFTEDGQNYIVIN